jgi:acetaldehyde dehydrogenase (acetylating)
MGDKDLIAQQEARDAVESADLAFKTVSTFDQEKIDRICDAMAAAALADSGRLGLLAHEETGYGKP